MTRKPIRKATAKKAGAADSTTANAAVAVRVIRLPHGQDLPLPAYQSANAAGLDLLAAVGWDKPITLLPGSRTLVPTGLAIELPEGYEAQVRPRSGLALKNGLTILNSPGTIDADYRGEVGVILANLGGAPFEIRRGERIAQLVIAPVVKVDLVEVERLSDTERGEGGFGSTQNTGDKKPGGATTPDRGQAAGRSPKTAKKTAKKLATAKKPVKPSVRRQPRD